jgi:hypothetical protein
MTMNRENAKDYLPLVQALAEGRTIQYRGPITERWADCTYPDFSADPDQYRIKPEPREIWANRHPGIAEIFHLGRCQLFATKGEAERYASPGEVQVCYREVLE